MSTNLLLSLTQEDISLGYKFTQTGITVYSFEEALYHLYYYWKDSQKDYLSDKFFNWVDNVLKLHDVANEISNLLLTNELSERYIKLLSTAEFFTLKELRELKDSIVIYESKLISDNLKEEGDMFFIAKDFKKALSLYEKAKSYEVSFQIYNNIGLCYCRIGEYKSATEFFLKALDMDKGNEVIIFNYTEALILNNESEKAKKFVNTLADGEDKFYLQARLFLSNDNYVQAVNFFNKAFVISNDDFYLYEIASIYEKAQVYEKALEYMDRIKNKNNDYLIKLSNILSKSENIDSAINYMERAITIAPNSVEIWLNLAKFHRMKKDYKNAELAISKASDIEPTNENVLLEKAIINKSQGKVKDYQTTLNYILSFFKQRYKESTEI